MALERPRASTIQHGLFLALIYLSVRSNDTRPIKNAIASIESHDIFSTAARVGTRVYFYIHSVCHFISGPYREYFNAITESVTQSAVISSTDRSLIPVCWTKIKTSKGPRCVTLFDFNCIFLGVTIRLYSPFQKSIRIHYTNGGVVRVRKTNLFLMTCQINNLWKISSFSRVKKTLFTNDTFSVHKR